MVFSVECASKELFQTDFSRDALNEKLRNVNDSSILCVSSVEKGKILQISKRRVALKPIKVASRQRVSIEFQARIAKGAFIDDKPQLIRLLESTICNLRNFPLKFARATYYFHTSKNLNCRLPIYTNHSQIIFSNEFKTYKMEFYVPNKANSLLLFFDPKTKDNVIEVKSISVKIVENSKSLNINPYFSLGRFNMFGWGYAHNGTLGIDGFGKPYLDLGASWQVGDIMPVKPGSSLQLTYTGKRAPERHALNISTKFYGRDFTSAGKNKLKIQLKGNQTHGVFKQLVPKKARWMRLSVTCGMIRSIKVEEINNSNRE